MANSWTDNVVNLLILALLPVYIYIHTYLLPPTLSYGGIEDAGFVSIITLTFIGSVFFTLLTITFNSRFAASKLTAVAASYVVLIYFMREADLHRLLTVEHVTRGKFYTMSDVPFWQKFCAALVFLLLAVCLLYLLFKFTKLIWRKVFSREPWAIALLFWLVVLFVSQLCDRTGFNDTHFGRVIEECSECWAAIFMFLAVIQIIPALKLRSLQKQESTVLNTTRQTATRDI